MKTKTSQQKLITFLPMILRMKNNKFSYREMAEVLADKFNLTLDSDNPAKVLSALVSDNNRDKLNQAFKSYKLLCNVPLSDLQHYNKIAVFSDLGFHFTYDNTEVNPEYLMNEDNLYSIPSLKGCIVAKRLLRIHDKSDEYIIEKFKQHWGKNQDINDTDIDFVNNIHDNILDIFNKLVKELKLKEFSYKDIFI